MRLIDADGLKPSYVVTSTTTNSVCHLYVSVEDINSAPTVDAVPVVRCRDCNWYQPDADKWCGYFECMGFEPDDYCSQGERKDGDGNG